MFYLFVYLLYCFLQDKEIKLSDINHLLVLLHEQWISLKQQIA